MEQVCGLPPYPIDMSKLLTLWQFTLDDAGVPFQVHPAGYHPTIIGQYALANWNQYLATNDDHYRNVFLTQANWLVQHEAHICNGAGGWPISSPHPDVPTKGSWLSALAQGNAISVLIRAFQLTAEAEFLEAAHHAIQTFKQDILDGGISNPVGDEGIFFEEVAVYPAAHILSGFIFGLFGLYDYLALTSDIEVKELIQRSLSTMHLFLDEFDVGFWTRVDLLHRRLASSDHLALQCMLLETLAIYSGCEHCSMLASRWKSYQHRLASRLRFRITSCCTTFCGKLLNPMQSILFPKIQPSHELRVCIPITAFPITGGMRAVLAKVAQVTSDIWQIQYLTQRIGSESEGFIIHQFGIARISSWLYTTVWFYCLAGFWKLISLIRHGANYRLILPQDGIFTAAFAACAAKLAGIRVVCIEHGNLTLLKSRIYHNERAQALATKSVPTRLLARLLYIGYWPSLNLLARFAAHFIDHYLIPGVSGDGVEEVCQQIGVHPSRITRFANMIDLDRHVLPDANLRAQIREKNSIPADAIVIAIICRLAPAKGLDIALEAMSNALSALSSDLRAQIRMIIAGDGPLRREVEEEIQRRNLGQTCLLWGEASEEEVISLLGISDIFLYTSRRGTGYPVAILEAMASACAIIASSVPLANYRMLAEGRGITVPAENVVETSMALTQLVNDLELCRSMGRKAREYVARQHSPAMLKRVLMRATYWSELDGFLKPDAESKG